MPPTPGGQRKRTLRNCTGGTAQSFLWLENAFSDPVRPQPKSGKLERRASNLNSSSHTLENKPTPSWSVRVQE